MGTLGLCLEKRLWEEVGRQGGRRLLWSRKVGDGVLVYGAYRGSGRGAKGVVSLVLSFSSSLLKYPTKLAKTQRETPQRCPWEDRGYMPI